MIPSSPPMAGQGPHHVQIDALRALACMSVLLYHLKPYTGFGVPIFGTHGGAFGVSLFFVLSGYLIHGSARSRGWGDYAVARLFRIFPAYWAALLLLGLASAGWRAFAAAHPFALLVNLLNLQLYYIPSLFYLDPMHVTWTLSIEVCWYALAPWAAVLVARRPAWLLPLLVASLAWPHVAAGGRFDALMLGAAEVARANPDFSVAWFRTQALVPNLLAQLPLFLAGAMIAQYRDAIDRRLHAAVLAAAALLCLGILPFLPGVNFWPGGIPGWTVSNAVGFGALLLLALRSPHRPPAPLAWVGKVSYSAYLYHVPIILFVHHKLGLEGGKGAAMVIATTLLVAGLSYRYVERPALRWVGRWRAARHGVSVLANQQAA